VDSLHDPQTEVEIIGGLLSDDSAIHDIAGTISPEDFAFPERGRVFEYLLNAYRDKLPIDMATIAEQAKVSAAMLAECAAAGWMTANLKAKVERVVNLAHKRRTHKGCLELVKSLAELPVAEISSRLSDMAASISLRNTTKKVYSAQDLMRQVSTTQEERFLQKTHIHGVRTGYDTLDESIRGLRPKRVTVIAAATGFGKSTFALNLFHNMVVYGKHKVLFLSNENDVQDNLDRLCGITARVDVKDVEKGSKYDKVCKRFEEDYWKSTAFISDNSPRNIDEVVATISRYAIQEGVEVAFVDYIGEIAGDASDRENEEMKLARYAQRLVETAKTLGIHIVILAQLNRQGAKGKPSKAELAGCYRIAQKAHSLLLFWQDDQKNDVVTLEKNRQGPPGVDMLVEFNRNMQIITEKGLYVAPKVEEKGKAYR
jgi:replicative DNA helicase